MLYAGGEGGGMLAGLLLVGALARFVVWLLEPQDYYKPMRPPDEPPGYKKAKDK